MCQCESWSEKELCFWVNVGVWSMLEELFPEIALLSAGKFHFVCPAFLVSCKLESCIHRISAWITSFTCHQSVVKIEISRELMIWLICVHGTKRSEVLVFGQIDG